MLDVAARPGARRRRRGARAAAGVRAPSRPARGVTRARVAKLKRPGHVEILTYRPSVRLTLTRRTGTGRVAWRAGDVAAGGPVRAGAARGPADRRRRRAAGDLGADRRRGVVRMTGAGAARLPAGRCVVMPRMPGRLRLLLPLAALLAPGAAAAPRRPPTSRRTRRCTTTARRAATCWTARGCSGSTRATGASSSGWNRSRGTARLGAASRCRTSGTSATTRRPR